MKTVEDYAELIRHEMMAGHGADVDRGAIANLLLRFERQVAIEAREQTLTELKSTIGVLIEDSRWKR